MELNIIKALNDDGSELTVTLEGRLDTITSPQLDEELEGSVEGIKHITFDLKNLTYISSAGLRLLLKYQTMKKKNGMKLKNIRREIMSILNITGFNKFLNIEA